MATYKEIIATNPNIPTQLSFAIQNGLTSKGVMGSLVSNMSSIMLSIMLNKFGNVDTVYAASSAIVTDFTQNIAVSLIPDFLKDNNYKFGHKETLTKTGTESDAGSFDNDPTTNDEFRSYPFDTTASDVQSKTRSIVNGAESGETSNVKTYNTTDIHSFDDESIELNKEIVDLIYEFCFKLVKRIVDHIRTSFTIFDPLSDDSTLLELEY